MLKQKKSIKGFTVIELLVTISIIAVLSVIGIVIFSSIQKGVRDAVRKADLDAIAKAYEMKYVSTGVYQDVVDNDFFSGRKPVPPEGGNYGVINQGAGFQVCAALENNPVRNCDTPAATCHCVRSRQGTYLPPFSSPSPSPTPTPTPTATPTFLPTPTPTPTPSGGGSFTCGQALVDSRDGSSYVTIQFGNQCWMKQNINIGTLISGAANQTNNSNIEKYCFSDLSSNCSTYGGLYQWNEAMQYAASCNGTGETQPACSTPVQGICPTGWHIPSHYEWTVLERTICTSATCATDFPYNEVTNNWQGTTEGDRLKVAGKCGGRTPCGTIGFNVPLSGYRAWATGAFSMLDFQGFYWASLGAGGGPTYGWNRGFDINSAGVWRGNDRVESGKSVRCLKS